MAAVDLPECPALRDEEHISLCETLDRVLNKGVVVAGEIVISVANIDLIYLGLQLVLTSAETVHRLRRRENLSGPEGGWQPAPRGDG
jgi:hypothetical protein